MTKKRICLITLICMVLVCYIFVISPRYVVANWKFYDKNLKEIRIDLRFHGQDKKIIKVLDRFSDLESIRINSADTSDLIDFPELNSHIDLIFTCSSMENAKFLDGIKSIGTLHLVETSIHFKGVPTTTVEKMDLLGCSVKGFENLASIDSLDKIDIHAGTIDGCIANNELYDSSVFSKFRSVTELEITGIVIKDVSGLMQMESLSKLTVGLGALDENQTAMLENKGVSIDYSRRYEYDEDQGKWVRIQD